MYIHTNMLVGKKIIYTDTIADWILYFLPWEIKHIHTHIQITPQIKDLYKIKSYFQDE